MGSTINTSIYEQSPNVTPDGKYLFFRRGAWVTKVDGNRSFEGKSYWVDARVIDMLKSAQ